MITKIFSGNKITIRKLSRKDLGNVKEFQDFINSLIEENAQIMLNKKFRLKEERKWIEEKLKQIKGRKTILLVAKDGNKVIATAGIDLGTGRKSHVGNFGIAIRKDYRKIGLGSF